MNTENENQALGKDELIMLRITGEDRPGLTASIMEILSKYDVSIQDIGCLLYTSPSPRD